MDLRSVFTSVKGLSVYCVGIKGTGMAAIAELLTKRGAIVSGSDTGEKFYTDQVLTDLGIPFTEEFRKENLPDDAGLVIHSAAYDPETNPEIKEAVRRGLPLITYPEALGFISSFSCSAGIAGTHGKTTTAGLCASVASISGLPVSVLVGSAVSNLGGRSAYVGGDEFFIAETCEYRRHFLNFHPTILVITNIEADHLDYFSGLSDVIDAFVEYGNRLPEGGALIYCADDAGAVKAAEGIQKTREDLRIIPYGREAEGPYRICSISTEKGAVRFTLDGSSIDYTLRIPGEHNAFNAAATAAVFSEIIRLEHKKDTGRHLDDGFIREGIASFSGSSRRSEHIGETGGIVFLDDYGHHPTEIKTTISGIKKFYPGRRLVVDFMSHTYTRTAALFDDFCTAFSEADEVVFHKIYASAREKGGQVITGRTLFEEAKKNLNKAVYYHEVMDAAGYLLSSLRHGDVFLTMGAGDNWRLGRELYHIKKGDK